MKCVKCEKEIEETTKFCPECGFNLEKTKKELADILKLKEEEKIAKKAIRDGLRIESKTTEGKNTNKPTRILVVGIVIAFLLFVGLSIPQYRTEDYIEPVEGMIYYGTLTDLGGFLQSDRVYSFEAISYPKFTQYVNDPGEYIVKVDNIDGSYVTFQSINVWNVYSRQGVVKYEQKSRTVCIRNC